MFQENWHSKTADETLEVLKSNRDRGLSEEETKSRLATYGANELVAEEKTSALQIFVKQFKNLLLAILLVATAISAALGETVDAIVIGVIVVFVVILGFVQEYRAETTLDALKKMLSPTCTVVRDGKQKEVAVKDVVPGDIIVLEAGDRIPADSRIIESANLQVNEAPLTGESVPVSKIIASLTEETSLADRTNMLFSGTTITYGRGKAVVIATGMKTEFGKIARQVTAVQVEETPLERRMSEIGRRMGMLALVIILVIAAVEVGEEYFTIGTIRLDFFFEVLLFGISLAVASVPEALPAIVTGSLAIGMYIMAKKNALIRKMPAVETLGSTQIICSDKTGTLTKGEMTVREVFASGRTFFVSGAGYEPTGDIVSNGKQITKDAELENLAVASVLCNDSKLQQEEGKWIVAGDPTEGALVVLAEKMKLNSEKIRTENPRITEVPFSSERKRMTTVHDSKSSKMAYMKGAPEVILSLCSFVLENGKEKKLSPDERKRIAAVNDEMASKALRVLAIAERKIQNVDDGPEKLEKEFTFLGLVGMIDPPRVEATQAVQMASQVGMKPIMITGDHKITAMAIAKEMGIYKEGDLALTGDELSKIDDVAFEKSVEKISTYARVSPSDKLRIVETWQKKGKVVAMTGDGVNDAPALKKSDIGIAMGITGTDVTKEAADMVLADDNFATIVKAIELGRWIYDNIKKYLAYLLQANLVEIVVMSLGALVFLRLFGYTGEDSLPLLPVHILYINLATDGLPALALGFSPPDPDLMKRPPKPKNEPVFTKEIRLFLLRAIIIEAPILLAGFISALPDGLEQARTRLFLMFVAVELVLALNCRSLRFTVFKVRPHKWLVLSVLWEIALIAILLSIPFTREAIHVILPTMTDILWVAAGALITFASVELMKHFIPIGKNSA
ncbi:MAG: cation-translocating P-type ATPase [Thaumarchaeota archaeon]|nr:cation-translocating P-type ATPase [Nitrososphaerota archaeon]